MSLQPPTAAELEQAAGCVERQGNAGALAAFCYDVLSTWADARALLTGSEFTAERAARHGVSRDNAATELGNVLAMLERGARSSAEAALISAFALRGFEQALSARPASERDDCADRCAAQIDWLEQCTTYRMTPLIERMLAEPARRGLLSALGRAVLRDDHTGDVDVAIRALNAARITVLARARSEAAYSALRDLHRCVRDPATLALVSALWRRSPTGSEAQAATALRIRGVPRTPSRSLPVALLRWISGLALLQALQRLACFLVAMRRELEIELRGEALAVRSRTSLLGRTLRTTEAFYDVVRVTGAFRRARFALLRTVVGVLSLSIGILLGGYLVFDGARGGAPVLLLLGAAIVAVGSSLDLVLNIVMPARRARVDVQVDLRGTRSLRLGSVEQAEADRLVQALSVRLLR